MAARFGSPGGASHPGRSRTSTAAGSGWRRSGGLVGPPGELQPTHQGPGAWHNDPSLAHVEEFPDDDGEDYDDSPTDQSMPDAYDEEDEEDDRVKKVVRRAVRRYPEESQLVLPGNRQVSIPLARTVCECPEVLSKGTLGAIVAALAFLGFFSTSMLLVVIIWVMRMAEKQKKTPNSHATRPLPPVPPPRPEHTYLVPKRSSRVYATVHPGPPAAEGEYLNANEINPGPRLYQPKRYGNVDQTPPELRTTPDDDYVCPIMASPPRGSPPRGSPSLSSPLRGSPPRGSPPRESPPRGSPLFMTPPVTTPPVPTYVSLEPQSGPTGSTPELLSPSSGAQRIKRGSDDHIYEEVN
ncbi:proline-rich protein 36-like isoform X2 [Hemicordylus capensis]|uniref:proline-rich protein 36-like isoform X2 n=1 Tax=Hemicordylus capensis TaxID=884348 RepID=UPI0023034C3B|nr:proline-rich protein 36-like isoform X2 [Hemicordylus capensis]